MKNMKRKFLSVGFSVVLFFGTLVCAFAAIEWFSGIYVAENSKYMYRYAFRATRPLPYQNSAYFNDAFLLESIHVEEHGTYERGMRKVHDFNGTYIKVKNGIRATTDAPIQSVGRIHLFGGSTLFSAEVPDAMTIASYLQRLLNQPTGVSYKVINHGVPSINSYQQLALLKRADVSTGDIVIFYDGVNDAIYNVFYGYREGLDWDSPRPQPKVTFFDTRVIPFLERNHFEKLAHALKIYAEKSVPENARSESELRKRAKIAVTDRYNNLLAAADYANQQGARFYSFLQPNLFFLDRDSFYIQQLKADYKLISPGIETAFSIAHPLFMDLTDDLRNAGVNAWDLTKALDKNASEVYLDFCHTNEVANQRVAEAMFRHLWWNDQGYSHHHRPVITSSSYMVPYDASQLFKATPPGWHAEKNPKYPQRLINNF